MKRELKYLVATAFVLAAGLPVAGGDAIAQATDLRVKSKKDYFNKPSGINLPYELAGYARESAKSYDKDELNISVQYAPDDQSEFLSIYVFRNSGGNASVWFDRARDAIERRGVFGDLTPLAQADAFAPPNQNVNSAMRIVYDAEGRGYSSTGLIIFPIGEWFVKIRATSQDRDGQSLNSWMGKALSEINWPQSPVPMEAAKAIENCETQIVVHDKAKRVAIDPMQAALVSGLLGVTSNGKKSSEAKAIEYCREAGFRISPSGVYRDISSSNSYFLALGDSGNSLTVEPDKLSGLIAAGDDKKKAKAQYAVSLHLSGRRENYMPRDRLPSPNVLMKMLNSERPVSKNATWGEGKNTVQIITD